MWRWLVRNPRLDDIHLEEQLEYVPSRVLFDYCPVSECGDSNHPDLKLVAGRFNTPESFSMGAACDEVDGDFAPVCKS